LQRCWCGRGGAHSSCLQNESTATAESLRGIFDRFGGIPYCQKGEYAAQCYDQGTRDKLQPFGAGQS